MEVIDERGRLFGRVNVVDALVVLLALSVVVAGAALVLGADDDPDAPGDGEPPENDTAVRYATLELGTHPGYVASLVEPGDVTLGGANATITDVYRSPRGDDVLLVARVAVEGRETDDGFRVGDSYLRYGVGFTLASPDYQIGTRVATTGEGDRLRTRRVGATVEANVSTSVADAVAVGDEQRIANDSVATVEAVETVDAGADWRVVRVDLRLSTRPVGGTPHYGGSPLRVGRALDVRTADYQFRGRVVAVEP